MTDEDTGLFILDRAGVVRYVAAGPYMTQTGVRPIPAVDEIVRQLEVCRNQAG